MVSRAENYSPYPMTRRAKRGRKFLIQEVDSGMVCSRGEDRDRSKETIMKAYGRDVMDGFACQSEDCDHDLCLGEATYLHSACHPGKPTWVRYLNGVAEVLCAVCEQQVIAIAVADETQESKS